MDKAISVDEDSLDTPLEPLKYVGNNTESTKTGIHETIHLSYQDVTTLESIVDTIESGLRHITIIEEETSPNHKDVDFVDDTDSDFKDNQAEVNNVVLEKPIPSILRRQSCYDQEEITSKSCPDLPIVHRKVSFPCDEFIATYREPEFPDHWDISMFIIFSPTVGRISSTRLYSSIF